MPDAVNKHQSTEKTHHLNVDKLYDNAHLNYFDVQKLKKTDPFAKPLTRKQQQEQKHQLRRALNKYGLSLQEYNKELKLPFTEQEFIEYVESDLALFFQLEEANKKYFEWCRIMDREDLEEPEDFEKRNVLDKAIKNIRAKQLELFKIRKERE